MPLRARYALSGTDFPFGPTTGPGTDCYRPTRCPVLTRRNVLPGDPREVHFEADAAGRALGRILRICYALSGTGLACRATSLAYRATSLVQTCYALCGTELRRMVLPQAVGGSLELQKREELAGTLLPQPWY
eukprot:1881927-Rhodomonas_salina.1